jgi:membrane-associated protease RseP (regulator of RpoE activity)
MGNASMLTNLPRGGAAALFTILGVLPLGAQTAGVISRRSRDSSAVVQILLMSKARIDTINALMRSFEESPRGSATWDSVRKQIEALMPSRVEFRTTFGPMMPIKGWIGINAGGVPRSEEIRSDGQYLTYFAHPTIVTVDGQSPAQRAGIMPGDMLVAYNGLDVVGRPLNLSQLLVPEKKLAVTVRRDGETKEFAVTVANAPDRVYVRRKAFDNEMAGPPDPGAILASEIRRALPAQTGRLGRGSLVAATGVPMGNQMFVISSNGVLGASVSTVGPELARKLKLEMGVLVNEVPEETPAWRSGLRTGDVIVNASGQPVASLNQLREMILMRAAERAVALRIIRDNKPQDVNVKW